MTSISHSNEKDSQPYAQWVEIYLNGKLFSESLLVLRLSPDGFAIPLTVALATRLNLPGKPMVEWEQQSFYAVESLTGVSGHFDEATQTLMLTTSVGLQNTNIYNLNSNDSIDLSASATGLFLNYDINFNRFERRSNLSALNELGVFIADQGVLTNRFAFFDVTGKSEIFRLDSQYTQDFPEKMATLVLGDSQTRASNLTGQVYFAGVQWRSNFSVQPSFQAFPLPSIQGSASAPSTVDIYVDNILRARQEVEPGPFAINNLPVPIGQGNINMVVHDLLGREQLVSQYYILGAQLLNPGIYDFSFESGLLRKNFGRKDNHYENGFISGTVRYGVSPSITALAHIALMRQHQVAGGSAHMAVQPFGIVSAGVLASRSRGADSDPINYAERSLPTKRYLQFDHIKNKYGLSIELQNADRSFWQLGVSKDYCLPTRQIQAQAYAALLSNTQLSIGYLAQTVDFCANHKFDIKSLNLGLSINLAHYGNLNFGFLKTYGREHESTGLVTWVLPLGKRRFIDANSQFSRAHKTSSVGLQQASAWEGGWGYRLRKTIQDQASEELGVNYIGRHGEALLALSRRRSTTTIQAGARGGLVALGGYIRPTRWLDDSFALVEVNDSHPVKEVGNSLRQFPINVLANNQKITQTDSAGIAFIPRLVAYENNKIALDVDGVPIEVELDLDERIVTPKSRMGAVLKFTAKSQSGMTLILHDENDQPFPAGTPVYLDYGQTLSRYEIALRGQVFVPTIDSAINIKVRPDINKTYICPLPAVVFKVKDILPTLGPYQCIQN